jgi:hypothetical protein
MALVPVVKLVKRPKSAVTLACLNCGCRVRISLKWLDEAGPPMCGCGGSMGLVERVVDMPLSQLDPYWQTRDEATVRLYHGDALEVLERLPSQSVHCVVTSPPYWGLRKYLTDDNRELGLESHPDLYVSRLVEVFRELRRVLHDEGTFLAGHWRYFWSQGRLEAARDGGYTSQASIRLAGRRVDTGDGAG